MQQILVSDPSVLIDLKRGSLLEASFRLAFRFGKSQADDDGSGFAYQTYGFGRQGNGPIESSNRMRHTFIGNHSSYIHQSLY